MTSPRRIVSLIASATEIVAALGCEKDLVGRSHECDFPDGVLKLPSCTEPKFDIHQSSGEIDRNVKQILQDALSVYRVDTNELRRLNPDVILTQSHCEVCAVSPKDVEAALKDWLEGKPRVVSLEPTGLADVWRDIETVAEVLDIPETGRNLVAALRRRMDAIASRARPIEPKPTVACIEWIDPLMAAGHWMPELVELAGGRDLFGVAGQHAPWMTWEDLVDRDPDVILVLPCGFDIERIRREMPVLTDRDEWKSLKAVGAGRVFLIDGRHYCNRPGPRLVDSLEIVAEILHPDHFSFGHRDAGWCPL